MLNFKMRYKMKKSTIKYIILFLSITVFSCDDYLATDSPSAFTESNLFKNVDYATKAVDNIYASFTSNYSYGFDLMHVCADSDTELCPWDNDNGAYSISHYDHSDGNSLLERDWNNFYKGIEMANICIENLPESEIWNGDDAETARYLYGQAVTLRALCYSWLINIWGDVPFNTKSIQGDDNFYVSKTDRDSIYEYLIQDLKDVEDYVPWMSTTQTAEEVNKAFVKGLRARMSLAYAGFSLRNTTLETKRGRYWEEYYAIARQECKEIMESGQHGLNPSYEGVFKLLHAYTQDNSYKETFAEVAFGRGSSGRMGYTIGMKFAKYDPTYGYSGPALYAPINYFYDFDKTDERRNVTCELYNYDYKTDTYGQQVIQTRYYVSEISKWRKSWISPAMGGGDSKVANTGVNWPLMRYADVVLMYAEAENELNGPTTSAKEALSMIRERAFPEEAWDNSVIQYVDSVGSSKESFFNAIVDERMFEFGGEFLRKWDLIRWNLLGDKLDEMRENYAKILYDDPKYADVPNYLFWKLNDDGETIDILNQDYRINETSIEGYEGTVWLSGNYASRITGTINTYLPKFANGYDAATNNHLYPIAATIIGDSNGSLSNDQMPW
jgi:hypothetical protein